MLLLSPLEQFQILSLIPIKVFNFDFSITNALLINIIALLCFSGTLYLLSSNKNCFNRSSFFFIPNPWQVIFESIYEVVSQLIFDLISAGSEKYFPFLTKEMYFNLAFPVFADNVLRGGLDVTQLAQIVANMPDHYLIDCVGLSAPQLGGVALITSGLDHLFLMEEDAIMFSKAIVMGGLPISSYGVPHEAIEGFKILGATLHPPVTSGYTITEIDKVYMEDFAERYLDTEGESATGAAYKVSAAEKAVIRGDVQHYQGSKVIKRGLRAGTRAIEYY